MALRAWERLAKAQLAAALPSVNRGRTERRLPAEQRRYLRAYVAYLLGAREGPPLPPGGMSEITRFQLEKLAQAALEAGRRRRP